MRPSPVAAALLTALTSGPGLAQSGIDALEKLKGTSRPVVVLSDSLDDPRVAKQVSALEGRRKELDERNITILREAQPGSLLRRRLGVDDKGFAVVLVGKDGSVKETWRNAVDPWRIFTVIDAMPMRRQEMKD